MVSIINKNNELEDKIIKLEAYYDLLMKDRNELANKNEVLKDKNKNLEKDKIALEYKNNELEVKYKDVFKLHTRYIHILERFYKSKKNNQITEKEEKQIYIKHIIENVINNQTCYYCVDCEAVIAYRDYIKYLEDTYIESKYKDNYFKNLYDNPKIILYASTGYLMRCNLCNEINPIIWNGNTDLAAYDNRYVIEIKYNIKEKSYYIDKIVKNICYCCSSECEGNIAVLEKYIEDNIINKIKIIEWEVMDKEYTLFYSADSEDDKIRIIRLCLDLDNIPDYSHIIKHLGWEFLNEIEKKWKDYNIFV